MKARGPATISVLDRDALRALSQESNSSKYAIDAHNRGVEEIGDLSELPKLCSLDVSFNRLRSLENLNTAKELRELKLYNNQLTSTLGLKANCNLETLMLHENQLDCLSADFLGLGRLKTLWLNGNRLMSLSNLTNCRHLVHLDLARNQLAGVASEGLESLTRLEYLNLSGNQLASIGNMSSLSKLEELVLSNNQLGTLAGRLPAQLSVLRVNGNRITDLATLTGPLPALTELYVHDNNVRDTLPLVTACPRLESLDIRFNAIAKLEVVLQLGACDALLDLWVQGNPFCQSDSYLLDVVTALPNLKTLDSMNDIQLQQFTEKLRRGAVTQEEALMMSSPRPTTPSSFRPVTPLRPGSSGCATSRPMTPVAARPGTPEVPAPVFHQPSARMGSLQKLPDPLEIERKHDDVTNRLREMKVMLQHIRAPGDDARGSGIGADVENQMQKESQAGKLQAGRGDAKRRERGATTTPPENERTIRQQLRGPETGMVLAARDGSGVSENKDSKVATARSRSSQGDRSIPQLSSVEHTGSLNRRGLDRPASVDAGTDPMDPFPSSALRPQTSRSVPPPPQAASSHHEMETQTASPPAAPVAVSETRDKLLPQRDARLEGVDSSAPWEPEFDGMMLEKEMKSFLLQHAKTSAHEIGGRSSNNRSSSVQDNQDDAVAAHDIHATDSPRLDAVKSAELRPPPTARSRQGYRSFRMPARPISPSVTD